MHTELRNAMRNFATGVCIASTYRDESGEREHDAVTINSLTSVSLDPPLVSMSLRRDSSFLADLLTTKLWAVSILDIGADDIAKALAKDRTSRAITVDTMSASVGECTGALVVDSPSWLECELRQVVEAGDHVFVIGEVLVVGVQERRPPLIFLHGRFQTLGGVR